MLKVRHTWIYQPVSTKYHVTEAESAVNAAVLSHDVCVSMLRSAGRMSVRYSSCLCFIITCHLVDLLHVGRADGVQSPT